MLRLEKGRLLLEVAQVLMLAAILAFLYNAYSPSGIPLVRREPRKIAVADSVLFSEHATRDSQRDVKIIAPLHESALANPDSMARLAGRKSESVFKIITLQQMKRLLEENRGIIIDARPAEEYKKGHIKGARNIPGLEAEDHFAELAQLPMDTLVIIYCNNPDCHLGRSLADFMNVMEFKKLYLYDEGWDGWLMAKMPVDSSNGN